MKWNAQTQQEARTFVETLTDAQWEAIKTAIPDLLKPSTPEQVKAREERQEAARVQRAAMLDDYQAKYDAFKRWREKKLKGLKMPPVYDFSISEVAPLTEYALHDAAVGHEGLFDTMSFMYDWGFLRGMRYQTMKQKAAASGANADSGKREKD